MLASGSSGNATYIGNGETHFLVDAGLSGRELLRRLREIDIYPHQIEALLLSHEHQDHMRGAGVLSRELDIPIMATEGTWEGSMKRLGKISPKNHRIIKDTFVLHGIEIQTFSLPHDAREPVGFLIEYQGLRVGIATDLGSPKEEILDHLKSCQLVILEANHDLELLKYGTYPGHLKRRIMSPTGHLSNDDAGYVASLLVEANVEHLILAHLSQENNHPRIAYHTVKNTLEAKDIIVGEDLRLSLVEHQQMGPMLSLK